MVDKPMSDTIVASTLAAAQKHPARRLVWTYVAWTVVFGAMGGGIVLLGASVGGAAFMAIGALFGWSGWQFLRGVREASLLNRALDACRRGEDEHVVALLDAAAARPHSRLAARTISVHRALLALETGEPKTAEVHATAAIERRPGLLVRDLERSQIAWAHAIRALARATLKDDAGALADAEHACDARYATPATYASGELARAAVAANGDRKAEVREILSRAAPLMDEIGGRERALARSLARFAADRPRTVYRHPAKPDEAEHGADFLQPSKTRTSIAAFEATNDVPLPSSAKAHARTVRRRTLVLWVLLILMFLAIWQVLNPSERPAHPAPPPPDDAAWSTSATTVALPLLVMVFGMTAFVTWLAMRRRVAFRQALLGAKRGEPAAIATLEAQTKRRSPEAALALAGLAERAGDFAGALARCEEGLAYVEATTATKAVHWEIVAPGLATERAFCLAALGRAAEADAVIGSMPNATTYAFAGTAHFRVRFAQALARGDRSGALDIARSRGDRLPIPSRDAFVADLLEATTGRGANDEEWARLHAELARDPALAKWVDHFMPKSALQRRVAPVAPIQQEELEETEAAQAAEQS